VVITTGTFLRGRIHIGTDTRLGGGRAGEAPTTHLAEQLAAAGLELARFKTGTPPRIDGRSVDLSRLERQESELDVFGYRWSHFGAGAAEDGGRDHLSEPVRSSAHDSSRQSRLSQSVHLPQLPCYATHLGAE